MQMASDNSNGINPNIDVASDIVIATRWNVVKYRLLHEWWIMKGRLVKLLWEGRNNYGV
jgi:hypothetical protein